jgi:hypothetical protein
LYKGEQKRNATATTPPQHIFKATQHKQHLFALHDSKIKSFNLHLAVF